MKRCAFGEHVAKTTKEGGEVGRCTSGRCNSGRGKSSHVSRFTKGWKVGVIEGNE